jgi:hypothetical protein
LESGSWIAKIFECLAGERSPQELITAADPTNVEQVCEGYYYAAEVSLLSGENERALKWFRKCVDTGLLFDPTRYPLDPMAEFHLARWRVKQLAPEQDTAVSNPAPTAVPSF